MANLDLEKKGAGKMAVSIRRMQQEDLEQVIHILDCWNIAPVKPTPAMPDPERSTINVENTLVALDVDQIVGVCSYIIHSPDLAETASLAVDPDYQGKGIGYLLQHARLAELKNKGIKRVHTETDRDKTIEWYVNKFGYRITGKNPKKHSFSLADVDHWTVLEFDLEGYSPPENLEI